MSDFYLHYQLPPTIRNGYDKNAWDKYEEFIINILWNMKCFNESQVQLFVRMLGGSDEVGSNLYHVIQEIFKTLPKM